MVLLGFHQATLRRVRKNTLEDVLGRMGMGLMGGFFTKQKQASTRLCTISRDWTHRSKAVHRQREGRENKVTNGGLYERFRKLSRCFFVFFL